MGTDSGRDSVDDAPFLRPDIRPKEPIGRHALGFRLDACLPDRPSGKSRRLCGAKIGASGADARQKIAAQLQAGAQRVIFTIN